MSSVIPFSDAYQILDKASIPKYLETIDGISNILGDYKSLDIHEIGDGNLNYVYRVSNSSDSTKSVIVKQAVPYLRMAGEDWPLARERMKYEIRALTIYNDLVPNLVPKIHHADEGMSTLVMQFLDDHMILRNGMIEGIEYPNVSADLGQFMAQTLFKTSAWAMGSIERRELMDQFLLNSELCKLTEEFIFTFPYILHESNYSNEQTDQWAVENIHNDFEYKRDILHFKELFVTKTEALVHGDLHSGSLMVNQKDSYIIDMEFAFFGPISFDIGKVFSNFLLCCTSHYHHSGGERYRSWILQQLPVVWSTFESSFLELWEKAGESTMHNEGFFNPEQQADFRSYFMTQLLQDSIGFAACSMARRTLGIAGVADIRDIEDTATRSKLEIANLKLSKLLMSQRKSIHDVDALLKIVNQFYSTPIL